MNQLINISIDKQDRQTVSGRELHAFLEIKTQYKDWFPRMCEYGFEERKDFCSKMSESTGGRPNTDHILTLDMAKELCMLARNEKGKQARLYFLQVEKEWNSPEKVMARALRIAERELSEIKTLCEFQAQQIAELQPIKQYMDVILATEETLTASQIAADYGMSAKELNKILHEERLIRKVNKQWLLYTDEMKKGYTKSETFIVQRSNGTNKTVMHTLWTQKGRLKIHEILTNKGIVANMDKESKRNA